MTSTPARNSILIVEDDSTTQLLIGRMVQKVDRDAEVHFARNAKTAIDLIQLQTFDLVISDNRLNGNITGLELFDQCKEQPNPPQFILISGSKIANLPVGAEAPMYFQKPLPPFKFRNAMQRLLLKNRPHPEVSKRQSDENDSKVRPTPREWSIIAILGFAAIAIAFSAIRFVAAAPEKSHSHGMKSGESIVSLRSRNGQ